MIISFALQVEVQIFGPYQAGKQQMYIAVALDTYSQFPDATTMEVLSPATLTHFILNLFCRWLLLLVSLSIFKKIIVLMLYLIMYLFLYSLH